MPIRVELIDEAVDDLGRYATSGNIQRFLAKLIRLEEVGKDAGLPLGRGLVGWRKIVVGDRNWRILFVMTADDAVATVWVVGDRDDAACYQEAARRLSLRGDRAPEAQSLAAVMFKLLQSRRRGKGVAS